MYLWTNTTKKSNSQTYTQTKRKGKTRKTKKLTNNVQSKTPEVDRTDLSVSTPSRRLFHQTPPLGCWRSVTMTHRSQCHSLRKIIKMFQEGCLSKKEAVWGAILLFGHHKFYTYGCASQHYADAVIDHYVFLQFYQIPWGLYCTFDRKEKVTRDSLSKEIYSTAFILGNISPKTKGDWNMLILLCSLLHAVCMRPVNYL